ncbi:MAG: hypothetical protein ACTIKU_06615 [Halomonas sp.]|uniref:hypothetical protein n=1 Tax=Gammaproteobacteria TaxID=1236 RepID=UPI001865E637|nr:MULTISPECIES: hypothetical protein [Gammaproteobacteria]
MDMERAVNVSKLDLNGQPLLKSAMQSLEFGREVDIVHSQAGLKSSLEPKERRTRITACRLITWIGQLLLGIALFSAGVALMIPLFLWAMAQPLV